jgi:hypothetical protein
MDRGNANRESVRAIPKDSTQITTKESPKREYHPTEATSVAALTPTSPSNDQQTFEIASVPEIIQEERTPASQCPEEQTPVPPTAAVPPTAEATCDKASNQRQQNGTTGKTSEKPKGNRNKSTMPSSGAVLLLDAWDEINGRRLTRTKEQVEATEELARISATGDDLKNVRDRLLAQKDGFWRSRGVSLKNVANNFHLAALGPMPSPEGSRAKTSPPAQSKASPVDANKPRKLLRRMPSATQAELLPIDRQQEARSAL